ncbi:MAG: type II and III secretion system protein [Candidatus Competibacteraceae bacterium]|nr:type II and III secretion system protein [Candidatus Competibacteraceae bacterium]
MRNSLLMNSCASALGILALAGGTVRAQGVSLQGELPPALAAVEELRDEHLVKILRTSNKAQVNRYVGKVYTFQHVNPGQINNYFHSALFREEGAAYTFVGPDGESGKIMVICPEYQLPFFDGLARDLDKPSLTSAPGSAYIYQQLRHRSAADPQFLTVAQQYASDNSVVIGDMETNAIFIWDSPSGADYLTTALAAFLDSPTPVVDTEVTIYEIDLNNDGRIGLDYEDYKNGPYQNALVSVYDFDKIKGWQGDRDNDVSFSRESNTVLVNLQYPSAYFDLLVNKGKARIVTQTRIVTSSRKPATLFTGEQILYYSTDSNDNTWVRTVEGETADLKVPADAKLGIGAVDAGVKVVLLPIVGEDAIELSVEAASVSITGFGQDGEPVLASRRADSVVTVPNGEEAILGGLTRERRGRSTYKVPLLGSLPVVGYLFGGETEIVQKSMMVIVLKPTIDVGFMNVTADDAALMSIVTGETEPELPSAEYGFDMWLLDSEN